MNRRSLLAAAAAVSVAGCTGIGGSVDSGSDDAVPETGSDDEGGSASGEPTPTADPDLRSIDLVEVDAGRVDGASVTVSPDVVRVTGTLVGETGCHGAEVASASVDDDGAFVVVVAAVDTSDPGTLCTQALTRIGYELDATFDDGVPEAVTVVHDDASGRGTAATASPDAA